MIRTTLALALLATMSLTSTVNAASLSDVKYSKWESVYAKYRGQKTYNDLTLEGCSGSYRAHGCTARLSDIHYNKLRCGRVEVTGRWHKHGDCGWFSFLISPCGTKFEGDWGFDRSCSDGWWDGDLCRRSEYHAPRYSSHNSYSGLGTYSGRGCSSKSCH